MCDKSRAQQGYENNEMRRQTRAAASRAQSEYDKARALERIADVLERLAASGADVAALAEAIKR